MKTVKRVITHLFIYFILFGIGFVFLYPILYMVSISFMTQSDVINTSIEWLPTSFYLGNYKSVLSIMEVGPALKNTVIIACCTAVCQTVSCAMAGYAFSRFQFPLKKLWLAMLVIVFVIPPQLVMIPKYVLFSYFKLDGSILSIILPALFGQGLKRSLIVLVFYMFFRTCPKSLDEAAMLDGASRLTVFRRVALPLSTPAIVVSFIFSFVWNWNETYQYGLLVGANASTLPLELSEFVDKYNSKFMSSYGSLSGHINEALPLSATLLTIIPLNIFYLFLQKYFVEGIESTGITGE